MTTTFAQDMTIPAHHECGGPSCPGCAREQMAAEYDLLNPSVFGDQDDWEALIAAYDR